jgi:hypothetical protein
MGDFLPVIFWVGFLCCFPVLLIGGPVGFVLYRNKQRREGCEVIAQALGLQPTARAKQMQWYEGQLGNGRLLAYVPIVFRKPFYDYMSRRHGSYVSAARLALEVKRERPLNAKVFRHESWSKSQAPLDSFETAFAAENGSRLTSSQQAALLTFARQYPGATIWLSDRADASTDVFNAPEVMADATSFLLFEYKVVHPSPEEIEVKVTELSRLARLFEA